MSQAALALLADDKDAAPEETPSQRAIALLEGRAKPAAEPVKRPSLAMAPVGAAEELYKMATGAVAAIPAGLAYGGAAIGKAFGADVNPSEVQSTVQNYFTHKPITDSAKAAEQDLATTYGPAVKAVSNFADQAATAVGKVSPTAETYMREAPAAANAAGGIFGLSPLASPAMSIVKSAPSTIASGARSAASGVATAGRKIAAAGEAASDTTVQAFGGTVRPKANLAAAEPDPLTGFGPDSASAAAASSISAAKNISPELLSDLRQQVKRGPLAQEAVDRQVDADALPIRMRLMEGQSSQEPEIWSHEFNAKGKDPAVAARFNEQNQQLIDNLDEFRREVAPQAVAHDPVQSGQNIVDAYKRYDETVRQDIDAKYQALRDANGGDFPVDGPAFVAQADTALKKSFKGRYVPSQVTADMEAIRNGEVAMDFEQFENLRTNLAAEARKAERSGDGNAAAAVNIVRQALESLPMSGETANIKPLADAARQAAKARFDRLRADPAYKVAADDDVGLGEASPLADKFVQKYIVGAPRAHVTRMMESLGHDDLAMETIRAAPFNYMKQKAGIDPYRNQGDFSQAGYNKALTELTPKLDIIVGEDMAEQAKRLGRVAYNVKAAPAGSFPNRSNTFIAATAEAAKGLAERSANTFIGGNVVPVGSWAREKMDARAVARESKERMRPAAGTLAKPKGKP